MTTAELLRELACICEAQTAFRRVMIAIGADHGVERRIDFTASQARQAADQLDREPNLCTLCAELVNTYDAYTENFHDPGEILDHLNKAVDAIREALKQ